MTRRSSLAAVCLALLIAACGGTDGADQGGDLRVEEGDIVEVHYDGTLDDGTIFDSSRDRAAPFSFTVGSADVITGFDQAVRGMRVGETVSVHISPEDAYGMPSDDNVFEVPIAPGQEDVATGDEVTLSNGRPGVVIEVKADSVVIDANHELVGEALNFDIELLSITRPTD
ncbi:MAG: peptidylprolyl isomerase [Actinobacteria bacterium]|nr:MAG: peptidylprolyl isomerase [Actinomycetota bacterium]